VGYSENESECNVSLGTKCTLKLAAPAGLQNGDVVVATIDMGGPFPHPPTPPDSTWVSLPIANLGNALGMETGACASGDLGTEYVLAHVYGSSTETGTYKFKHVIQKFCATPTYYYKPELEGAVFGYRGASATLSNYVLYGYPATTESATVTVGPAPASSPSEGILLNIFFGGNYETPESNEQNFTFGDLTGTPAATAETPPWPGGPYYLADVGIPDSGTTLGQYSITNAVGVFQLFGWQLFVP
jgi:hypothetical protein